MDFSNMGSIKELLKAGGPVLILLVCLSVYSISVMIERFLRYRQLRKKYEVERNHCTPHSVHAALLMYGEPQEV